MGRLAVEWCPAAYIGDLYRAGALHHADGRRRERVRFELFEPVYGDSIGKAEAPVAWLPTPLGGWRPLFVCPRCRHRREWLYALAGLGCRVCWGLAYQSQKQRKERRRWEALGRAERKLDTDDECYLIKPKWMRVGGRSGGSRRRRMPRCGVRRDSCIQSRSRSFPMLTSMHRIEAARRPHSRQGTREHGSFLGSSGRVTRLPFVVRLRVVSGRFVTTYLVVSV